MKIFDEKDQMGHGEMETVQFGLKKSSRKINIGTKSWAKREALCDKEIRTIKEEVQICT